MRLNIVKFFEEKQITPLVLVFTHGHIDHIAGINAMREKFPDMKVYIHKLDSESLDDPMSNLSFMTGDTFKPLNPRIVLWRKGT